MTLKNSTVLVTGVSGFVGAHVAQQLLLHGYQVRGTVRDITNQEKLDKLRAQITTGLQDIESSRLEFVQADLLNDEDWPPAVAGCEFVCHVASPFPMEIPDDPDVLIKPAVNGTLSVLKAASQAGVKRVALTSSLAAIHDVKTLEGKSDKVYNEDDWVDPDKVEPYSRSKILAEKAAHQFVEDLAKEGKPKLELVVINPSFVLGPLVSDTLSSSITLIKRLLDKSTPAVPKLHCAICDVRDVALAHVKALESAEYVGKRFLIVTECIWMKDLARILQKEFKPLGYFVPTMTVPSTLVWLGRYFDKTMQIVAPRLDKEFHLDNKRMVEELKITPTGTEKTILDTAHSLVERGVIKASRKYKEAKQPTTGGSVEQPETVKIEG